MTEKKRARNKTTVSIPKLDIGRFGNQGGKTLKVVFKISRRKIGTLWIGKSVVKWGKPGVSEEKAVRIKITDLNEVFTDWKAKQFRK